MPFKNLQDTPLSTVELEQSKMEYWLKLFNFNVLAKN